MKQHNATQSRNDAEAANRYLFLDGLRGLAAISVVIHHFALTSHEHRRLFGSAPIAVDFFFCVSGFVIAYAYQAKLLAGMTFGHYVKKRLVRLYPMYLIGMLLGLAAILALKARALTDFAWLSIAKAFALNLFYLPYFNSNSMWVFSAHLESVVFPLDNPAWSLFFELACANLLYAITIRFSKYAPLAWTLLSAFGVVIATSRYGIAPGWGSGNFVGGFPRVLFAFFAGVLVFQGHDGTRLLARVRPAFIIVLLVLMFALPRYHFYSWLFASLVLVPAIVTAASWCVIRKGSISHRVCQYSGRLSYPIYCIHYPLLMMAAAASWPRPSFYVAMALFVIACILVTHFLMEYVDEPLRESLRLRLRL